MTKVGFAQRGYYVFAIALLSTLSFARSSFAQLLINEVEYDEPSTDTAEYIELKNVGAASLDLTGYSLVLVNGANDTAYATIALPSTSLGAGQYFVVCANAALTPNCNLDVSPDTNLIQNGAPDAIALELNGVIQDSVSYEGNVPGFTETNGAVADDGSLVNSGISRCPDGSDSQNNGADFRVSTNTPGAANSCGDATSVPLGNCGDAATLISTIQGSGSASPLAGQPAVVEAVVVGDFQAQELDGFFLEEPDSRQDANPATSEGLFVFQGSLNVPVAVGNVVRVRGEIAEFSGLTELTNVTDIVVCPGSASVSTRTLTFPVASVSDLENFEGMLVNIPQQLTVTGNFDLGRFGSLDLSVGGRLFEPTNVTTPGAAANELQDSNDRSRIILDDLSTAQDPNPIPYKDANNTRRVGDTLPSLTGIVDGRLGAYRIQPTGSVVFSNANVRSPTPPAVGGRLRVSSFNVLNFFTTLDTGAAICGPTGGLGCRGANSALEFSRQRTKILNALTALNADVVGLTEIENNASTATQSLVDGLNAALGNGTYSFIDTGSIGSDAIKVALLYKPAKVTPFGAFALLSSAVDPRFIDTKNRPALAQAFSEVGTGARFSVVLNHLKSKGSDCNDVGDPDLGDGQGNCNHTRTQAALALRDWIATDPTHSGDADYLIIGDLNSYAKEDPITTLKAGGFHALTETFIGADAYSFQFDGQSGYLDHALASPSLAPQVAGMTEWHINCDEPTALDYNTEFKTDDPFNPADPFRASDHDPVLVGLNLAAAAPPPVPANGAPSALLLTIGLAAAGALGLRARRKPSLLSN